MATLTYISNRTQNASVMKNVIDYCKQDLKVTDPDTDRRYVTGVNCDGENSYTEFTATKKCFHKANGIFFYQYTQSFSPEENITPALAHEIALEFAERAWQGYEVMVATHVDREHIHSHFVINSVSYVDGKKLRQSPKTLLRLRALNDEICQAHGLSVLEPYTGGGTKISAREYRAAMKGQSWKFRLMANIEDAMDRSGSKAEFIQEMANRGYEVRWTAERKYITFTCPNGMKCRDIKLHDDRFLKEMMEHEFRYREQITRQIFDSKPYREESGTDADDRTSRGAEGSDDTLRKAPGRDRFDQTGSTVPTGAVPSNIQPCYDGGSERSHPEDRQYAERVYDESDFELYRRVQENDRSDSTAHRTGWEESREVYFGMLLGAQSGAGQAQRGTGESQETNAPDSDHGLDHGNSSLGAGILSALPRSPLIEDDSEDEEERRKRIEAEQNGSDLGAALGLAIGLIAGAASDDGAEIASADDDDYIQDEELIPTM